MALRATMSRARWGWIVLPTAIAVASRLYSTLVVLLVNETGHPPRSNPFVIWDTVRYLGIAADGYSATPFLYSSAGQPLYDFAFFPAWPAVIRLGSFLVSPSMAAVLLADALFVMAAVLIWRLCADRLSEGVATGAILLMAFAPPAYAFSIGYSESLFLVLASTSLLARRSMWRGPLGIAAMLTRIAGGALVISSALKVVWTHGAERRAAIAAVAGGVVGFALWWVVVAVLTGDPMGFLHGSPNYTQGAGASKIVAAVLRHTARDAAFLGFALLMLAGSLALLRKDRELAVYALAVIAMALLPGATVNSMPRYALAAFPAFAGLASSLDRRVVYALMVACAIGQVLFAAWAVRLPRVHAP